MGESLRDIAREKAVESREALGLWICRVRVSGSWRPLDKDWGELRLRAKVGDKWYPLVPAGFPLIVARRFSGGREAPELAVVAALKQVLGRDGAVVVGLAGSEARVGDGVTEWRYWAELGARTTVAVERKPDGTVGMLGLA